MKKAVLIAIIVTIMYSLGYNLATDALLGNNTYSKRETLCVAMWDAVFEWNGKTVLEALPDNCIDTGFEVKKRTDDVYPDENYEGMCVDVGCKIYRMNKTDFDSIYVEVEEGRYYFFELAYGLTYPEGLFDARIDID